MLAQEDTHMHELDDTLKFMHEGEGDLEWLLDIEPVAFEKFYSSVRKEYTRLTKLCSHLTGRNIALL